MNEDMQPSEEQPEVAEFSSKRAKILVTMLGAEFASSAPHPFFRRLVELAAQPTPDTDARPQTPSHLSATLRSLVSRLERKSSEAARRTPKVADTDCEPDHEVATNQPKIPSELIERITELKQQHPAVIAWLAKGLPPRDQKHLLLALPGRTSRQVTMILMKLQKTSAP